MGQRFGGGQKVCHVPLDLYILGVSPSFYDHFGLNKGCSLSETQNQ